MIRVRAVAGALAAASLLLAASCGGEGSRDGDTTGGTAAATAQPAASPADSAALGAHRAEELDAAARRIIGFLRGEVPVDRIRLADTVTLYLTPEPGGARRTFGREMLRDPASWRVRTQDLSHARGMEYSIAPPRGRAELTTRVGRHFRCREYALSSIYRELAQLPHVGTMLAYGTECLQTRNLTLVFDPNEKPPTLVAAVYDQWEW